MTDPTAHGQPTYIIDAEKMEEMRRLAQQDRLLTRSLGGLFPERPDLSGCSDILDLACGPGGWVLGVAKQYPRIRTVGVDISKRMIEFCRMQAERDGIANATFEVMDVTRPLALENASFDLVNARLIIGFMPKAAWPELLAECRRVLRPGGLVRFTESELPFTNSRATDTLNGWLALALHQAGIGLSPNGRQLGITPLLARFFRDAGYQEIQSRASGVYGSWGSDGHAAFYHDGLTVYPLLAPFLLRYDVTTQEEFERVYHQALEEMQGQDFCALWFYLSVLGQKPLT